MAYRNIGIGILVDFVYRQKPRLVTSCVIIFKQRFLCFIYFLYIATIILESQIKAYSTYFLRMFNSPFRFKQSVVAYVLFFISTNLFRFQFHSQVANHLVSACSISNHPFKVKFIFLCHLVSFQNLVE